MPSTEIFQCEDYRAIIKTAMAAHKSSDLRPGQRPSYEKMAKACRVMPSYLSSALGGKYHLNSDQIFVACQYLKLSSDETEYALALAELERSAFESRKLVLKEKIEDLKRRHLETKAHLNSEVMAPTTAIKEFYLDFNAQLVHMFLSIERYQTSLDKIAEATNLSHSIIQACLKKIEAAGLIAIDGEEISFLDVNTHLPPDASVFPTFRSQMRWRALCRLEEGRDQQAYTFSALFSTSDAARTLIKSRFLEFIGNIQAETQDAPMEEVFQLNFDLLKWS